MKALYLELTNFRNYIQQELDFSDGVNVIYGDNAQGKTNILEALYFLSTLKSPRTSNIKDFINFNTDEFSIKAEIESYNLNVKMVFITKKVIILLVAVSFLGFIF